MTTDTHHEEPATLALTDGGDPNCTGGSDEGDPNRAGGSDGGSPRAGRTNDSDRSAKERELLEQGVRFARATVVRREPPVSANVGDRAVITADGELFGWVGGAACAQSIVTAQALEVIASGEPQLVGIAPDPDTVTRPGLEAFPMTCHSEGVLEVFIEPVAPSARLVIVGDSPIAQSLARLASELSFDVTLAVAQDAEFDVPESTTVLVSTDPAELSAAMGPRPLVVAASVGGFDARGIAAGVLSDASYIGLVASNERAAEEIDRAAGLLDRDPDEIRSAVTNPAGVDIAARAPTEIAASILAELVDARAESRAAGTTAGLEDSSPAERSTTTDPDTADSDTTADTDTDDNDADKTAIDPVCGMTVEVADPAATVEHEGETYYFCCHGCADSFTNDPGSYLDVEAQS